jgi:type 1 glutamine amidotransferase
MKPLCAALAAGIVAACLGTGATAAKLRSPHLPAAKPASKRLLVVTHTAGFRHDSIPVAEEVLAQLGRDSGAFTVDYCRNAEDVKKMLTPEGLKGFDGVIFANTTGPLGIPDLKWFMDWLKSGKAFIGMHSAGDTYHPKDIGGDTSYVDMLQGEFKTHHRQCEIDCIIEDPKHPATAHLGSSYKVFDEIYLYVKNTRANTKVLLSLDKHPNDGAPEANTPGDYLIAWCHNFGRGKVFYTALGHRKEVWKDPVYQQHILGGIKWATGLAKGDATIGRPQPKRP